MFLKGREELVGVVAVRLALFSAQYFAVTFDSRYTFHHHGALAVFFFVYQQPSMIWRKVYNNTMLKIRSRKENIITREEEWK